MARGVARGDIFVDDEDREAFVLRLAASVGCGDLTVYAWALMPNHLHLLAGSPAGRLSVAMRRLLSGYAGYFNRRHRRVGHLFQNRFKSLLVDADEYFLELVRYVHLNPVRSGLVATLDALEDYPWTGHQALRGEVTLPWQAVDAVLALFGSRVGKARAAYRSFLVEGLRSPAPDNLGGGALRSWLGKWLHLPVARSGRENWSCDERVLGSAVFVESVCGGAAPRATDVVSKELLGELLSQVAGAHGVPVGLVASRSLRPAAVAARAAFCRRAVELRGCTLSAVAAHLGISRSSVARALAR
jgi:REP element-mobilizing transposase RayT